jgi:hypothetical protein
MVLERIPPLERNACLRSLPRQLFSHTKDKTYSIALASDRAYQDTIGQGTQESLKHNRQTPIDASIFHDLSTNDYCQKFSDRASMPVFIFTVTYPAHSYFRSHQERYHETPTGRNMLTKPADNQYPINLSILFVGSIGDEMVWHTRPTHSLIAFTRCS